MLKTLETKAFRYAVIILNELARDGARLSVDAMTRIHKELPRAYTAKLMGALERGGVLSAQRGPAGGFALQHRPTAILVTEILHALEKPEQARIRTGSGIPSAVDRLISTVRQAVDERLATVTLADLLKWAKSDEDTEFLNPHVVAGV